MDVMKTYEQIYNDYKAFVEPSTNRHEWAASEVFGLATYDPTLDWEFVEKIIEVCKVILNKQNYEYIKDDNKYRIYILVCQLLRNKDWIDWETSIRGAWFSGWHAPDAIVDHYYSETWQNESIPFSEDNLRKLIEFIEKDKEE